MTQENRNIAAADGVAQACVFTPAGSGPWPGVIYLTDIWGIRPDNQGMARRVADQGYAVLMPNVFYRTDHLPIVDFDPVIGEARTMRRLSQLMGSISPAQMERDGAAYAEALLADPRVKGPKVAVAGYCFTGQMALRIAAAVPEKIAAAASFHGGGLVTERPDSPHTVLPRVAAELYFGHAVEDQSIPPAAIAALDLALQGWGGRYTSEIYPGAKHGWSVPGRPAFDAAQAERHYEKLFDLLKRTLG